MTFRFDLARVAPPVQRRLILDTLHRLGPTGIDRIPAMWPLADHDVARIVAELEAEGAVALGWDRVVPGRRTARITSAGERVLRTLDDAAMEADVAETEGMSIAGG